MPSGSAAHMEAENPSSQPKKGVAATYLEMAVDMITRALNARELDLSNPTFAAYIDPGFASAPGPPAPQIHVPLDKFLSIMKERIDRFPDYFMNNLHYDTYINEKVETAEVYVNYELTGVPTGVTKMGVSLFRFRRSRLDSVWRCYNLEVANGMDGSQA